MCRPLQHDEIVGRANQVFIAVFPYDDLILDADASPAGNIESIAHRRNPKLEIFPVSAKTGEGMDAWCDWLRKQVKDWQA